MNHETYCRRRPMSWNCTAPAAAAAAVGGRQHAQLVPTDRIRAAADGAAAARPDRRCRGLGLHVHSSRQSRRTEAGNFLARAWHCGCTCYTRRVARCSR